MNATDRAASDIKALHERIYVPRHEYRDVDARSFRHLDLQFYDRVRDALVAQGCTWLGDVEDVTLKGTANDFRTFIRFLVSADGAICIGLYHPKPKWWLRLILWVLRVRIDRTIDCETELPNGSYITTSNAAEAGKLNAPPGFDMKFFPAGTDPQTVFQAHGRRLVEFLRAHPAIRPTVMRTSQAALDMQHRMQSAKAAFRKAVGYVTEDELKRLGADARAASEIKQAMNRSDGGA